jgi:tRNA dimethylallyltransferase
MVVTTCPHLIMPSLSERQLRRKPLVVILGPTAVGKSRIAVDVAKYLGSEILTADSRQVYRGMDVGTDKPTLIAREGITHRLIDLVDPDESFNAGLYRRHAAAAIDECYRRGMLPLLVGGTGLYVRTLLQGLCEAPPSDPLVRARLRHDACEQGSEQLYARLVLVDPLTAAKLHPRDTSKILRALEVYLQSGLPLSSFQSKHGFSERPFSALVIGLNRGREQLYRRIEERIDWQLTHGLVDETQTLLARGYRRDSPAMKGLGYRHVARYLAGDCSWDDMGSEFKRDTRRFAKRQMTWFRREPELTWLMIEESEPAEQTVSRVMDMIHPFLVRMDEDVET